MPHGAQLTCHTTAIILELYVDAESRHWVRFMYNGKEMFLRDLEPELDTKDDEGNARIVANAEKVLATFPQNDDRPFITHLSEVEVELGGPEHRRKETLALCPYDEFRRVSGYLIPVDYEKECAIDDEDTQ